MEWSATRSVGSKLTKRPEQGLASADQWGGRNVRRLPFSRLISVTHGSGPKPPHMEPCTWTLKTEPLWEISQPKPCSSYRLVVTPNSARNTPMGQPPVPQRGASSPHRV